MPATQICRDPLTEGPGHSRPAASAAEMRTGRGATLPDEVADWPEKWGEWYEERAGIMEYDGGMARPDAEPAAEELVRAAHRRQQAGQG